MSATPAPALDLAKGFEAFMAAARRLEASHAALTRRADAVDLELAQTNRALQRALSEREAMRHEVDRLDRLAGLSELALGIAHEIKNPLNGVMGFASLFQTSSEVEDQRRYAAKVVAGLAQVDGIVREMLALAGSPQSAAAKLALSDIVDQAAEVAGVPRRCIELSGAADERVGGTAVVRVLANLFRNSAEALEGGVPVIGVVAEAVESQLQVRVTDAGPGVAVDLGSRVFEPFVTTKDTGHGLGLALAARVMSFLGGSLELLETAGKGARFCLTLPLDATCDEVGSGG